MTEKLRRMLAVGTAVLLGSLSALTAPMVLGTSTQAGAAEEYSPCSDPWIEEAIFNATGEHTGQMSGAGLACNPYLYNGAQWQTQAELQGYVNQVLTRCGTAQENKLLVLALLETTGIPPKAGVAGYDNVCHQLVYEQWWDATSTQFSRTDVDWTKYIGGAYPNIDVFNAVNGVMSVCNEDAISHAVVSVTDRYPVTNPEGTDPNRHVTSNLGLRGQCDPGLYRNGAWESYGDLKQRVINRATSSTACGNTDITQAARAVTGWNPLPGECDAQWYGGGSWNNDFQELVNRYFHSLRCENAWLGQFYAFDIPQTRQLRGRGWMVGECNHQLYTKGAFVSYEDARSKVLATNGVLVDAGAVIERDGDVELGGTEYDGNTVLVGSTTGGASVASTLGGATYSSQSGGDILVQPSNASPIISNHSGKVISTGGGNVISTGGGNVISTGGGNVISTGGLN